MRANDSALRDWVRALEGTAPVAANPQRLLYDAIAELADAQADAPALIAATGGESLTYRALVERANRYARWALDQGLIKGETICLMMPNRPDYLAIWLGLSAAGVIVALINTELRGHSLAHCIDIVSPKQVIIAAECAAHLQSAAAQLMSRPKIWMHGESDAAFDRIDRAVERHSVAPLTSAEPPPGDDRRPRASDLHVGHDRLAEGRACQPPAAAAMEFLVRRIDEHDAVRPHVRLPADVSQRRRRGRDRRAVGARRLRADPRPIFRAAFLG